MISTNLIILSLLLSYARCQPSFVTENAAIGKRKFENLGYSPNGQAAFRPGAPNQPAENSQNSALLKSFPVTE